MPACAGMTRLGWPCVNLFAAWYWLTNVSQGNAMDTPTIHTAKTTLSRPLARVESGKESVLARGKQPVAKIVPYRSPAPKRQFGALPGIVAVGLEFFEPLPDDELAAWEQ
jgi:antitoxin (DNA-binding transcriptional repressor) of toxin-antitoxin stability system